MKIKIIQIGKIKNDYVLTGMEEFIKRLKPFANLEFLTLKEIIPGKTFPKEKVVEKEGEEILKAIGNISKNENHFVVALDEHGKEFTSMEFAKILENQIDQGQTINFIIGGPYGLAEKIKNGANLLLSFSRMTFTHQMIRLFLLEQIYRGVMIIKGKEYHHE